MFPKGSISISLTVGNEVDLIKTHLYHLACKLVWFSGPIILSNLSRPRRKRKSSKGLEHSPTSSRWIIVWFANIINDQSKRVFFVAILDPTSMIREVPSSSPTSCMFHALLGVRRSFLWLSIIHHYIFIYTHLILLTASIIHHPIHILIYHPPSTSNLIVMEDVWHGLETGCNPISLFDTSRIPEGSRKVCSSCPLLHLGCQRCLLIILKELSLSSSSCFLGLLLHHCCIR